MSSSEPEVPSALLSAELPRRWKYSFPFLVFLSFCGGFVQEKQKENWSLFFFLFFVRFVFLNFFVPKAAPETISQIRPYEIPPIPPVFNCRGEAHVMVSTSKRYTVASKFEAYRLRTSGEGFQKIPGRLYCCYSFGWMRIRVCVCTRKKVSAFY